MVQKKKISYHGALARRSINIVWFGRIIYIYILHAFDKSVIMLGGPQHGISSSFGSDTKYCYSFHTLYCMRCVKQCKQRLSSIENGRHCQKEKSKLVGGYTCGVLDMSSSFVYVGGGEKAASWKRTPFVIKGTSFSRKEYFNKQCTQG